MPTQQPHRATFVGVLPGPRNGMTLFTEAVVDEIRAAMDLREFDIGRAYRRPGLSWRVRRMLRSLRSALWLLLAGPREPGETVYLVANSHGGLYYNLLQAAAARLRGFEIVLHHHVYSYISRSDWRMRLMLTLVGPECLHVVACPMMGDDLDRRYRFRGRYACVAPSVVSARYASDHSAAASLPKPPAPPLVIGHLSNLTVEKGVGEVIDTVRRLAQRGVPVRCLLAGPCATGEARRLVEAALRDLPDVFEWLGPVYGEAKAKFFQEIHAFVFPTRYKNESWGMVLDEALTAGVPSIAYRAGCTPHLLGVGVEGASLGGVLIHPPEALPPVAVKTIEQWASDPEAYREAVRGAQRRGEELAIEGEQGLARLIAQMRSNAQDDSAGSRESVAGPGRHSGVATIPSGAAE